MNEDRFQIVSRLGSGSFGIVYEAFDRYRNRTVALKMLERAVPDAVMRFKREFRYLAELRHPNLASLYELLVLGDKWALSMELVRGSELLQYLAIAELQNSMLESRQASTQRSPIFARCFAVMKGAGASSMTFWWRRCIEQSRSPRLTTLP